MRKILICVLGIIALIGLTGCEASEDDAKVIFTSLKKEKIIDKDSEYVETVTEEIFSYLISTNTYYIYQDSQDNLLAIQYSSCQGQYNCDDDYVLNIYKAKLTDKEITYVSEDDAKKMETFYLFDGKYAQNNKYDLDFKESYFATKHKGLFKGIYYTFKQKTN